MQFSAARNICQEILHWMDLFHWKSVRTTFLKKSKALVRNDDINVQELEDELTYHYKDEDFESIETDFEDPINV